MAEQINLDSASDAFRQFVMGLRPFREPVDLVSGGQVVARLTGPAELSEAEKRRTLTEGLTAVKCARAKTKGIAASQIQKMVDEGVREERSRAAERNH